MEKDEVIKFWQNGAKESLEVAEVLFKNKRYNYCLFFCQLALEKYLKGLIVKNTKDNPLLTHDLVKLAERANLDLDIDQKLTFKEITDFNLDARYDDYKLKFYHKATKDYAEKYLKITKELLKWLKSF